MKEIGFSIAENNFFIKSNISFKANLIFEPQAYNLNINFLIEPINNYSNKSHYIQINSNKNKLDVVIEGNHLNINGDLSPMDSLGYNKQFGIYGNKGLVNHFILSELEASGISTLHASAVINPNNQNVIIALGSSGSGKSVFVANALSVGYELIASEHVLIDINGNIYPGNQNDNISPKSVDYIRQYLPKAVINNKKMLIEPIGQKVMTNFSEYCTIKKRFKLNGNYKIIVMNYGNMKLSNGLYIKDHDFILRIMQAITSEKICSPMIFNNQIFDSSCHPGKLEVRNKIIENVLNDTNEKIVLGGDNDSIKKWLEKEFNSKSDVK